MQNIEEDYSSYKKLQFLQKISSSYGLKIMENIKEDYSSPLNYPLQQKSGLLIFLQKPL